MNITFFLQSIMYDRRCLLHSIFYPCKYIEKTNQHYPIISLPIFVSTKGNSKESYLAMYPTKYFSYNLLPMHNTELLQHTKVVSLRD